MSGVWLSWAMAGLILALAVRSDLRHRRIPNAVTFPAIVTGMMVMAGFAWSQHRWETFMGYVAALVLAAFFGMGMERGGVWSAGDSKLFLALAVWIDGAVPPFVGTGMLIGFTALGYAGLFTIRRYGIRRHSFHLFRRGGTAPPLRQACRFPGSLLIAAASVAAFLLSLPAGREAG